MALEGSGMEKTTLRLPPELWKRIRMLAVKKDTTAQALVIKALEKMLKEEK